jgi:pSer/pThr/pTyr-binding forkhead associated (FHA) protein
MVRTVDDRHEIIDLESTNGTQVNTVDVAPHQAQALSHGDRVRIGQTVLEYVQQ